MSAVRPLRLLVVGLVLLGPDVRPERPDFCHDERVADEWYPLVLGGGPGQVPSPCRRNDQNLFIFGLWREPEPEPRAHNYRVCRCGGPHDQNAWHVEMDWE